MPTACILVDHRNKTALEQMLAKRVGSILKYTNSGGAVIISAERDGTNVRLSVQDNGIGIPNEFLDKVFDRTNAI